MMKNRAGAWIAVGLAAAALAACSTSTPTPIVVTATPEVAVPTEGPPPTAIPGDPEAELGPPNGMDNFDNDNNWTLFDNECFTNDITGGQFAMHANGVAGFSCWTVSWPKIHNFYYQSVAEMPEQCNGGDKIGLFLRAPDNDSGYMFGITCDGRYDLTTWDGETTEVVVSLTASSAINTGPQALNTIGIVANGTQH